MAHVVYSKSSEMCCHEQADVLKLLFTYNLWLNQWVIGFVNWNKGFIDGYFHEPDFSAFFINSSECITSFSEHWLLFWLLPKAIVDLEDLSIKWTTLMLLWCLDSPNPYLLWLYWKEWLGYSSKILLLCFFGSKKVIQVWNPMRENRWWQNFHFWVIFNIKGNVEHKSKELNQRRKETYYTML